MMTVTPNDVCLAAHWANVAFLRNEVPQSPIRRNRTCTFVFTKVRVVIDIFLRLWYTVWEREEDVL